MFFKEHTLFHKSKAYATSNSQSWLKYKVMFYSLKERNKDLEICSHLLEKILLSKTARDIYIYIYKGWDNYYVIVCVYVISFHPKRSNLLCD